MRQGTATPDHEDPAQAQEFTGLGLTLAAENLQAQGSKIDPAAMEAVAEASTESLKNTIQPQVDALWDAVKWVEDRMEIIDKDRRAELEDAARTAAQNTAKVNPRIVLFEEGTVCCPPRYTSTLSQSNKLIVIDKQRRLPSFVY